MGKVLFKFCSASGAAAILKGNAIFVTSPLDLNDPFEMRPGWTDDHEARFSRDQGIRSRLAEGAPILAAVANDQLQPCGTMPFIPPYEPTPVDSQRGIADSHNSEVFRDLHSHFRILSLVGDLFDLADGRGESDAHATLMWSHYADQFQGVCLAIDTNHFCNGIREDGFDVKYPPQRQSLSPGYYDCWGSVGTAVPGSSHQPHPASSLHLTNTERAALDQHYYVNLLTHKSPAWEYEREVRMIYELPELAATNHYRKLHFP